MRLFLRLTLSQGLLRNHLTEYRDVARLFRTASREQALVVTQRNRETGPYFSPTGRKLRQGTETSRAPSLGSLSTRIPQISKSQTHFSLQRAMPALHQIGRAHV